MIEDLKTLLWFLRRLSFYATMVVLIVKKFLKNRDREKKVLKAFNQFPNVETQKKNFLF